MSIGNFVKSVQDVMRMDAGINGDAQRIEQMVWLLFLKIFDVKEQEWELMEDNYQEIVPTEFRW
ncbi:MAG: SAM-dependent DNA methyltransferase, partial [Acetoanaerobium sp.]|nr:SAM-dependent DNA methyltransferase [Acetoanaerobium sp.]